MSGVFQRLFAKLLSLHRKQLRDDLRAEGDRILARLAEMEAGQYRNVMFETQRLALLESAEFARRHLGKVASFSHPHDTLQHALKAAPTGGLALEFGVFSGTTLKMIADARGGQSVFGFDSFQGLPEMWRAGFPAGAFAVEQLPQVAGAELVVGWFDETLPKFLADHPGPVDFLHVDCDLYSSTRTVLELVGPRLRPGSVVMFDEFFNYPGWQEHEAKAWDEYLQRSGTKIQYEAFTLNNEQVAARIVSV
jgi:hypothetical protein